MNPDRTNARDARRMAAQIARTERHAGRAAKHERLKREKEARKRLPRMTAEERARMVELEYIRTREPGVYAAIEAEAENLMSQGYSEGEDYTEMSGIGKKLKKALNKVAPVYMVQKKVMAKVVPKKVAKKARTFEQHHRKEIKTAAGVAALALGAYAIAPGMIGGAVSNGVAQGKALAMGLGKKLGIGAVSDFTWDKVKDRAKDEATDKMADMVKRMGQDKFNEIVSKYKDADGDAPTDPNDPRLQDLQAELLAASQKIDPNVARTSVIQEAKASPGERFKAAAPYIGAGAAILSLLR